MINYPLSDDTWDNAEYNAMYSVIQSKYFTMGEKVSEFEKSFSSYIGSRFSVMVNSGSSANLLAIAALFYRGDIKPGDEVIVPAVSWSTTYYPLHQYGLKLNFVDIDRETLNIDVKKIEQAITSKTKAIFAVNLLGNPNQYDQIIKICNKNRILLIEDNCESLGARYKNKFTGTFGVIGTFSMFYSHHICTMEGGIACTNDEELYHYMLALRAHGWTRNLPSSSKLYKKKNDPFYESFNFILPGYNLRPLEVEGAIGIEQIKKLDDIIAIRRMNADYFIQQFYDFQGIQVQKEIEKSSWFGFSMVLTDGLENQRKLIVNKLINSGVEVRPIVAGNFTRNEVIKYFNYKITDNLTNADYIHENGFFVGNHSKLIYDKIDLLVKLLRDELTF